VKDDRIGSITHVDGTCRIQTLKNENPLLRKLMERFYDLTGCPVLLNTSLNVAGEPIMSTRDKVDELLMTSELNYGFVGNEIIKHRVSINDYS
jgi:carbamoyltransferase